MVRTHQGATFRESWYSFEQPPLRVVTPLRLSVHPRPPCIAEGRSCKRRISSHWRRREKVEAAGHRHQTSLGSALFVWRRRHRRPKGKWARGQEGKKDAISYRMWLMLEPCLRINMLSSSLPRLPPLSARIFSLCRCMPEVFVDCAQGDLHRCIDGSYEPRKISPQSESFSRPHAMGSCHLRRRLSLHLHGLTGFNHVDDHSFSLTRV